MSTSIRKRAQQRNFAHVFDDTLPLGAVGLPWLEQPEVNHPRFMLGERHCCQPLQHPLGGHKQLSPQTKLKLSKSSTVFEGEALVEIKTFPKRSASLGSQNALQDSGSDM